MIFFLLHHTQYSSTEVSFQQQGDHLHEKNEALVVCANSQNNLILTSNYLWLCE